MEVKDLFVETKQVIAEYKAKAENLDQEEQELQAELVAMQEEMTAILLDQENANLSERIYLKAQAKGINSKLEIVNSMLEELNEKRSALKLAYVPVFQEVLRKDRSSANEYDVTELAIRHRYELLTKVADMGKQFQNNIMLLHLRFMRCLKIQKLKKSIHVWNTHSIKNSISHSLLGLKHLLYLRMKCFQLLVEFTHHLKQPKEGK